MQDLTALLLARPPGSAALALIGGDLIAWTGLPPYANTVQVGSATYINLPVLNPGALSLGRVLLINTPGGPIVLGRLHQAT